MSINAWLTDDKSNKKLFDAAHCRVLSMWELVCALKMESFLWKTLIWRVLVIIEDSCFNNSKRLSGGRRDVIFLMFQIEKTATA